MAEDFNLQSWLQEMRQEQREDYQLLSRKVDDGFSTVHQSLSNHKVETTQALGEVDKRLVIVENTRRAFRWAMGTMFAAGVTGLFDLVVNHLPKFFRK